MTRLYNLVLTINFFLKFFMRNTVKEKIFTKFPIEEQTFCKISLKKSKIEKISLKVHFFIIPLKDFFFFKCKFSEISIKKAKSRKSPLRKQIFEKCL